MVHKPIYVLPALTTSLWTDPGRAMGFTLGQPPQKDSPGDLQSAVHSVIIERGVVLELVVDT